MKCINKCCEIKINPYTSHSYTYDDIKQKYNKCKAGIFFYDPNENKILLVQSRGFKWGFPKGTMEKCDNHNVINCAIREVLEETGYNIPKSMLTIKYVVDKTTYFYIEHKEDIVYIQPSFNNDANGICWIKVSCLLDMVNHDKMKINYHCKKLLKRFLLVNIK